VLSGRTEGEIFTCTAVGRRLLLRQFQQIPDLTSQCIVHQTRSSLLRVFSFSFIIRRASQRMGQVGRLIPDPVLFWKLSVSDMHAGVRCPEQTKLSYTPLHCALERTNSKARARFFSSSITSLLPLYLGQRTTRGNPAMLRLRIIDSMPRRRNKLNY
jgi:hypothetical protein